IGFLKKNGKTVGFQVIIRDITERKRPDEELQESEMKYRELFEGSTNPITILGRDGFILMVNGVAARNLGLSPEACVGKSIFEMIPNLDNSLHELYQQIVDTGIEISREDCIELPSRGSRWFWSVNQPVSDINGRRYGVQIISYDITKRKKVEMELKEAHDELYLLNKDLEKKIQERTEKIRNQNEELTSMNEELTTFNEELTSTQQKLRKNVEKVEKLAEEKDDFIHMLGHDLKNPLTSINMLLPLIEKKEQDHELKEQLQVAILSVNQMKVLINETLKLARLNDVGGEIELGDIQLKDEVETVINNNLILINGNDIVVENRIDEKLIVRADKLQLDELLDNLIINAVKYIPDDKNGIVTINARAENDDFVKVSVKDTGTGLTSEQKTHVFDKFYKTGKPRSGMESSGLGLSICKQIIEKHGGQIWAESPGKGKGSIFYFTLKKSHEGR
ncbi:MAG: PAS domain S-box protein, partial [Thermoplasmatales archaeon]|nr:PAS domain S-box protein [Thermoplasmatales archaeon]